MQGSARPFPLIPLLAALRLSIRKGRLPPLASRSLAHWPRSPLYAPQARGSFGPASGDGEKIVVGFAHTEQGFALHLVGRMHMLTQKTQCLSSQTSNAVQGAALQTQFPLPHPCGEGGRGERVGTLIVGDPCRHFLS